ncbi:MAG TPA: carbohydrate kinase family protein [Candidatus Thermoplasmatota archaeon]|nr:carbohydrate kinase family protein [Candidatus Thermoplasmatota archaeon]
MPSVSLEPLRRTRAVVLPDLYVDALAFLPPWAQSGRQMGQIARRGGGNLPVGNIEFKLGGNAANLAVALARLGAQVDLIAHTDEFGHRLLQRAAAGTDLRTEGVRVGAKGSATLGLECGGSNVMLSHAGPLQEFGPERLTKEDWERIESADAVALVNWAQNQRGTALLKKISSRLGRRGTFLYLDTGDVRNRLPDLAALRQDPSIWKGVGAFGMNQNELGAFAAARPGDGRRGKAASARGQGPSGGGVGVAQAQELASELGTRIDLHTREWAASVTGSSSTKVPAGRTPAVRLTGAGDTWNAGNLAGYMIGLPDRERLSLAHRVATRYVTGRSGLPPTAQDVAP